MTDKPDDGAKARMDRRAALIASAKQRFAGLDTSEQAVLSYGVQVADAQAQDVLRISRSLDR